MTNLLLKLNPFALPVAHAANYFNLDPGHDLASSTLSLGGAIFGDLSPVWTLVLGVGVALLFIGAIFAFIRGHH